MLADYNNQICIFYLVDYFAHNIYNHIVYITTILHDNLMK